jgi:hypothetical protein
MPAALAILMVGRGARAGSPQERGTAISAQPGHLGIPELPGGPTVAPVRGVSLEAVSRCPGGVGGGVVPGAAAGDEKAEGLAHGWLLVSADGCLTR